MSSPLQDARVRIADPSEIVGLPTIEGQWDELARHSALPYALFSSPAWWHHSQPITDGDRPGIGIVEAPGGSLLGVVPAKVGDHFLNYPVGSFSMGQVRLKLAKLLGYEPLIPNDERILVDLVQSFLEAFKDCEGIQFEWVSHAGDCWNMMSHSRDLRRDVLVYIPGKLRGCHFVNLPDSYEQYLARFTGKHRWNLRRKIKRLREHGGGRLDCLRFEHESDVPYLLESGSELSIRSSTYRNLGWNVLENTAEMRERLCECARRGVLRSYLLRAGDELCAFIKGYQYGEIYYVSFIGFDERFAEFSPGTMLHCMVVEDLLSYRRPKRMNLGAGEWSYLDAIGTDKVPGASVLLLRKTIRNRLLVASHSALRSSVNVAKRLKSGLRRTTPGEKR
jgi:hypothetical protein